MYKKMYKFWISTVLLLVFQSFAHSDDRIVTVDYYPNQIVEVYTSAGYATTIEFGAENINAVAVGDTSNWQASPFKNKLFIKPTENNISKELKSTNMTVVTDKRDYYFQVYLNSKKKPTFILKFNYPPRNKNTSESNKKNMSISSKPPVVVTKLGTESNKSFVRDRKPTVQTRNTPSYLMLKAEKKVSSNSSYKMSVNSQILIDAVYDNGADTFFVFGKDQVVPDIYYVNERGEETLLISRSLSTKNHIISVNKVAQRFTLREGEKVTCILNDKLLHPELYLKK
ncbi:MAG: hypothetical protein GKC53_01645 [Neisseriaceae bacterium]|nr:MAG: hypothetical protein GKC53_01645 [Neisseriaceae bacterium]